MNELSISGRITKDPVTKIYDGGSVTNFSIAHNYTIKKTGEKRTSFFDVVYFANPSKTVEFSDDLVTGAYVVINGYLRQDRWTAQDGSNRSKVVIVATNLDFPDGGSNSSPYKKENMGERVPPKLNIGNDDDVPF